MSEIWNTLGSGLSNRRQELQNKAAIVLGTSNGIPGSEALGMSVLEPHRPKAVHMYKVLNALAPSLLVISHI